jgi:hypothetical protein
MLKKTSGLFFVIALISVQFTLAQKISERKLKDFKSIRIVGQIQVELLQGDENKIYLESEDVEVEKITTEVDDGELVIKVLSHLFKNPTIYAKVTFKRFNEISAHADAEVIFKDPVIEKVFDIKSTSGANIELEIDSDNLNLEAFQGGQVLIKGETTILDAYVNTGGILSGTDLICKNAKIKMNTGGKGEITVKKSLDASINTGANFSYFGTPDETDVSTSLGGKVSAWDEEKQ